jgi:hypothetical protein
MQKKMRAANTGISPTKYAYYIRCERMKKNEEQCRAPALKGTRICYKHTQKDETARRREEAIARLELPPLKDARSIQVALHKIGQAIVEGQIDEDCGGYLLRRVQAAICGGKLMRVGKH